MFSSEPAALILVSCFAFVGLTGQIVAAAVDADDHALVDLDAVADEQRAPILQVEERVGERLAG